MGIGCYLTKTCYVSLGMKTAATKQLRDTPKEEEKHPKATRKEKERKKMKTAPPRRPRAHGPRDPVRTAPQEASVNKTHHPVCTDFRPFAHRPSPL